MKKVYMKEENKRNPFLGIIRDILVMCSPTILGIVWEEGQKMLKEAKKKKSRKAPVKKSSKK